MNFTIDYSEPIPKMIERLKKEHLQLLPELSKAKKARDVNETLVILDRLKSVIMRHAVEEEARVLRVIMENAKSEAGESIRIMQEHRWVSEFLERRLENLQKESTENAISETRKFISDLEEHFREEEDVVFPLALRASGMNV